MFTISKLMRLLYRLLLCALILMLAAGVTAVALGALSYFTAKKDDFYVAKPVIYLYPTHTQQVTVTLNFAGTVTTVYPAYNQNKGWKVIAQPNGDLTDIVTRLPYSYLFWEGSKINITSAPTPTQGFVVKGNETSHFLREKLSYLGLTPKEYNEMIVYWLPRMQHNNYNLIYFAGRDYTDKAKLTIKPKPDSILRVFMIFKPLNSPIHVREQKLARFIRKGFVVIEWGGTQTPS
jgi:hypothetical protein